MKLFRNSPLSASLLIVCALLPLFASAQKNAETVIYTGEIAAKVYGYGGKTPLNIHIQDGVITKIDALDNYETPQYFARATKKIFPQYEGKTIKEALDIQADAATGATCSSEALIDNIRIGLQQAVDKSPSPKSRKAGKSKKSKFRKSKK
ncbi:MAG: FMN-binding protein [Muribaculaceae bacterium]|nr:FMN-binding protein [Muribaculaceae bacterium]